MSIFPPTRIGRALVVSAVLVGVTKVLPFLLQVVSMTGDERTELPPLTPAGTTRDFLLGNPVTWFLAVAAAAYVLLVVVDVVVFLARPRPARSRQTARSGRSTARKPPARAPRRTATASAGRPRPTSTKRTAPARRPAPAQRSTTTRPRPAATRTSGGRARPAAQRTQPPARGSSATRRRAS